MGNSKILLIGLLLYQSQTVYSQQFSGETNAVYINTKKVNAEAVKLPLVNWLSPELPNSNSTDDSVALRKPSLLESVKTIEFSLTNSNGLPIFTCLDGLKASL